MTLKDIKYCPKCGAIKQGYEHKFCYNCGSNLNIPIEKVEQNKIEYPHQTLFRFLSPTIVVGILIFALSFILPNILFPAPFITSNGGWCSTYVTLGYSDTVRDMVGIIMKCMGVLLVILGFVFKLWGDE